jgi:hypothetical protein
MGRGQSEDEWHSTKSEAWPAPRHKVIALCDCSCAFQKGQGRMDAALPGPIGSCLAAHRRVASAEHVMIRIGQHRQRDGPGAGRPSSAGAADSGCREENAAVLIDTACEMRGCYFAGSRSRGGGRPAPTRSMPIASPRRLVGRELTAVTGDLLAAGMHSRRGQPSTAGCQFASRFA